MSMPTVKACSSWVFDDGGRSAAGFKGQAGDCLTRAISIATSLSYQEAYDLINRTASMEVDGDGSSARTGSANPVTRAALASLGFTWRPTMSIGSGCTTHLRADELPSGVLIAKLSKHVVAVIDGVVHDTYDPSREGTRCVYGYWTT